MLRYARLERGFGFELAAGVVPMPPSCEEYVSPSYESFSKLDKWTSIYSNSPFNLYTTVIPFTQIFSLISLTQSFSPESFNSLPPACYSSEQ